MAGLAQHPQFQIYSVQWGGIKWDSTWAPKGLMILYDDKDYVAISDPANINLDEGMTGTRTTKKLLGTVAEVQARIQAAKAANPTAPDPSPQNTYFEWQIEAMQIVTGGQKRDVYKENRAGLSSFVGNVAVYINYLFSFSGYGGGPMNVFTDVDWPYRWRIDQAAMDGGAYKATLDTPSTQAFKMGIWKTIADPTPLGIITFEAGETDGTVELFGDITFADETEVLRVEEWIEFPAYTIPSSSASNLRVYLAADSIRGDDVSQVGLAPLQYYSRNPADGPPFGGVGAFVQFRYVWFEGALYDYSALGDPFFYVPDGIPYRSIPVTYGLVGHYELLADYPAAYLSLLPDIDDLALRDASAIKITHEVFEFSSSGDVGDFPDLPDNDKTQITYDNGSQAHLIDKAFIAGDTIRIQVDEAERRCRFAKNAGSWTPWIELGDYAYYAAVDFVAPHNRDDDGGDAGRAAYERSQVRAAGKNQKFPNPWKVEGEG